MHASEQAEQQNDAPLQGEVRGARGRAAGSSKCLSPKVPQEGLGGTSGASPAEVSPSPAPEVCWAGNHSGKHAPTPHVQEQWHGGGGGGEVGKGCNLPSLEIKSGATFSPDLLILHPVFPCTSLLIGLSSLDSSLLD